MIPDLHELEHWLVGMNRPPALAADLYQYALDDPDTRVPMGRLTHRDPTYPKEALKAVLTARAAVAESEIGRRRREEPCEHGDPGGMAPHPRTGEPLCALCRSRARLSA